MLRGLVRGVGDVILCYVSYIVSCFRSDPFDGCTGVSQECLKCQKIAKFFGEAVEFILKSSGCFQVAFTLSSIFPIPQLRVASFGILWTACKWLDRKLTLLVSESLPPEVSSMGVRQIQQNIREEKAEFLILLAHLGLTKRGVSEIIANVIGSWIGDSTAMLCSFFGYCPSDFARYNKYNYENLKNDFGKRRSHLLLETPPAWPAEYTYTAETLLPNGEVSVTTVFMSVPQQKSILISSLKNLTDARAIFSDCITGTQTSFNVSYYFLYGNFSFPPKLTCYSAPAACPVERSDDFFSVFVKPLVVFSDNVIFSNTSLVQGTRLLKWTFELNHTVIISAAYVYNVSNGYPFSLVLTSPSGELLLSRNYTAFSKMYNFRFVRPNFTCTRSPVNYTLLIDCSLTFLL